MEGKQTRKRLKKSEPNLEHGKLPPQAVDLERAVLGALMLDKHAILEIADIITEKSFYKETHQMIFGAISDLNNASEPIDILTVTQKLKQKGELDVVGGPYTITELTSNISSAANIEYHARIIEEKKIKRDVIRISSELITQSYDDTYDTFDITEKFLTEAYELGDIKKGKSEKSNNELLRQVKENIQNAETMQGITGVRSGLLKQDLHYGGYQNSDLIIKAARTAMGKTSLALCEANHMANVDGKKVLFFNLEMKDVKIMQRIVSIHTEIPTKTMNSGKLTPEEWAIYNNKTSELMNNNLKIIDIPGLTLNGLRKISKKHALKHGLDCIYVDYLQLMRDPIKGNSNREQEISRISAGLKVLAKDLDIPLIALAQLSRAVETRGGGKIPQLSDLRESGSIEQDADIVQFIYRPEYYGFSEDEEGNPTQGRADLITAKNRSGELKTVHVQFVSYLTKFKDLPEESFESFDNSNMPIGEDFDTPRPVRHIPTSSQDRKDMDDAPF